MIYPNRKYREGALEIVCYGRGMIMVKHPQLSAPLPVGPKDEEEFWEKHPAERLITVCDYLDAKIDWKESSPETLIYLGREISMARGEAKDVLAEDQTDEDSSRGEH